MFVFKERKEPYKKDYAVIPNGEHYEIEVVSTFHLKNIYKHMHQWLDDNDYYDAESGKGENFETLFYQITKPNGLMFHHIWWRVLKDPPSTSGNNIQYFMRINFQTIAVSKHETMVKGKKFKTYKGDVIIRIKAYVRLDPKDKWDKHPIIKHFQKALVNRWLRKEVSFHKKQLFAEVTTLQRLIKQYMGGHTDVTQPQQWNDEITGV